MEKKDFESKAVPTLSAENAPPIYGETETAKPGIGRRIVDSFRRDPNAHVIGRGADGKSFDIEGAAANTASSPLARRLKGRHLQMIAIGGSIGTIRFSEKESSRMVIGSDAHRFF